MRGGGSPPGAGKSLDSGGFPGIIKSCGDVAQLEERLLRMQEVRGSNPLISTTPVKSQEGRPLHGRGFFCARADGGSGPASGTRPSGTLSSAFPQARRLPGAQDRAPGAPPIPSFPPDGRPAAGRGVPVSSPQPTRRPHPLPGSRPGAESNDRNCPKAARAT